MIILAFALCAVLVYITVKSVWGLFKNWKEMDFKSRLINITLSIISVGGFAYILWKQKAIQDVIEFIRISKKDKEHSRFSNPTVLFFHLTILCLSE